MLREVLRQLNCATVYAADRPTFGWHVYTEGWAFSAEHLMITSSSILSPGVTTMLDTEILSFGTIDERLRMRLHALGFRRVCVNGPID